MPSETLYADCGCRFPPISLSSRRGTMAEWGVTSGGADALLQEGAVVAGQALVEVELEFLLQGSRDGRGVSVHSASPCS